MIEKERATDLASGGLFEREHYFLASFFGLGVGR